MKKAVTLFIIVALIISLYLPVFADCAGGCVGVKTCYFDIANEYDSQHLVNGRWCQTHLYQCYTWLTCQNCGKKLGRTGGVHDCLRTHTICSDGHLCPF